MRPHHERTIDKLTQRCQANPTCLALILVGSLAAGKETDRSDVDYVMAVTDHEFARRRAARQVHNLDLDLCDYEGGYAEGKAVSLDFLRAAATRGSEPARSAFMGARVLFSHVEGLENVVAAIPVYPKAEKADKIARFYANMKIWQSYLDYGEQKASPYLLALGSSKVALLGGRLILAHNEILYPYHKWFMWYVENAPLKPEGFMPLMTELLTHPTAAVAERFRQSLDAFMDLERHSAGWISQFVLDSEWNWLDSPPPVEDC